MIDIICAICGRNQQVKILYPATFQKKNISKNTYSARRLPDKIHYQINQCLNCGLVFSSPIPPLKKLSSLYRESACNYKDQIPYLIKTYFKIIERIKKGLCENPKVLEVGCGNGFFLKALMDLGLTKNVFGVEPSLKMVSEADPNLQNRIKISIFKPDLFSKDSFDLICCFHTLDHMIDPNGFIKGALDLLRKNGFLIAVVHDTKGLSVKIFKENSAIFDVEHIYLFDKKTLKKIFSQNKFTVIDVFDIINTYPLNYWIRMSGFPLIIKKISKYIFNLFKIGKMNISIPAGNIGIIARKSAYE